MLTRQYRLEILSFHLFYPLTLPNINANGIIIAMTQVINTLVVVASSLITCSKVSW